MYIFLIAISIALVFTLAFAYGSAKRRNKRFLTWSFVLLLLPVWALSLWLPPYGPTIFGVAFIIPMLVALAIIALLSFASHRNYEIRSNKSNMEPVDYLKAEEKAWSKSISALSIVFLLILAVAIFVGYNESYFYKSALM